MLFPVRPYSGEKHPENPIPFLELRFLHGSLEDDDLIPLGNNKNNHFPLDTAKEKQVHGCQYRDFEQEFHAK